MNRRNFGLAAGSSMLALMGTEHRSFADTPDVSLLKTTLTPFGAERAGNAAGTIPAWTGGLTAIPSGSDWDPNKTLPPDFFQKDAVLYEVNASNMAQYADLLSDGLKALIKAKGFYVKVYPTRRTQALPQSIYDNIARNAKNVTAQVAGEYRLGFNGGYGGIPFPILSSDPYQAGAQAVWNHEARYNGSYRSYYNVAYTVEAGTPDLVSGNHVFFRYDYYLPKGGPNGVFDGRFYSVLLRQIAPSTAAGDESLGYGSVNPLVYPIMSWSLLTGQGRVRRTPNLQYDTPMSYDDDIVNYDEGSGFSGALNEYDWKLLGKREMLIPYNNNKIFGLHARDVHKPNYYDPEAVRWELHRVWVVEATLHPGERNVFARRTLYLDEDTWIVSISDNYNSAGGLVHHIQSVIANFPNLPANVYQNTITYALQTGNYVSGGGSYADPPYNAPYLFGPIPASTFSPTVMAAGASY